MEPKHLARNKKQSWGELIKRRKKQVGGGQRRFRRRGGAPPLSLIIITRFRPLFFETLVSSSPPLIHLVFILAPPSPINPIDSSCWHPTRIVSCGGAPTHLPTTNNTHAHAQGSCLESSRIFFRRFRFAPPPIGRSILRVGDVHLT